MARPQPIQWQLHDRLIHRDNADLGPGRVLAVQGRMIAVVFPRSGQVLKMAANSEALRPLVIEPGNRVRIDGEGSILTVAELRDEEGNVIDVEAEREQRRAGVPQDDDSPRFAVLSNGEVAAEDQLWPAEPAADLITRLEAGQVAAARTLLEQAETFTATSRLSRGPMAQLAEDLERLAAAD